MKQKIIAFGYVTLLMASGFTLGYYHARYTEKFPVVVKLVEVPRTDCDILDINKSARDAYCNILEYEK